MKFTFKDSINKYLESLHFEELTPIQEKVIPLAAKGKDIIGLSDTGTGKTHAYLIPILDKVDTTTDRIQAVIITPTRELARQIYENLRDYCQFDKELRVYLSSSEVKNERIERNPHIVVGTPGRLKDQFFGDEPLRLDGADTLIIDEADMTMEFGFLNDVDAIAGHMRDNLQIMAFSATMPQALSVFLQKYMHNPVTIKIKNDENYFANVTHYLIPSKQKSYEETLLRILPGFNPYLCLIFTNTKNEAAKTAELLRENGYKVLEIHGDLTTRERKNAMKQISQQNYTYIVGSDIAARGIDIPGVSHVVSLGFPSSIEYYIHRAGRTGRIKHEGICYAIYKPEDDNSIRELKNRGINFQHSDYRGGIWHQLKPYGYKRQKPVTEMDKEISKIARKEVKKVKPGYKKKRAAEIEKIKRKYRRNMIQESIRKIAKEKNRLKQREKNALQ